MKEVFTNVGILAQDIPEISEFQRSYNSSEDARPHTIELTVRRYVRANPADGHLTHVRCKPGFLKIVVSGIIKHGDWGQFDGVYRVFGTLDEDAQLPNWEEIELYDQIEVNGAMQDVPAGKDTKGWTKGTQVQLKIDAHSGEAMMIGYVNEDCKVTMEDFSAENPAFASDDSYVHRAVR